MVSDPFRKALEYVIRSGSAPDIPRECADDPPFIARLQDVLLRKSAGGKTSRVRSVVVLRGLCAAALHTPGVIGTHLVPSYPEIAAIVGLQSHASALETIRTYAPRLNSWSGPLEQNASKERELPAEKSFARGQQWRAARQHCRNNTYDLFFRTLQTMGNRQPTLTLQRLEALPYRTKDSTLEGYRRELLGTLLIAYRAPGSRLRSPPFGGGHADIRELSSLIGF